MPAFYPDAPAPGPVRYGKASFQQAFASVEEAAAQGDCIHVAFAGATSDQCKDVLAALIKTTSLNVHQYGVANLLSDRYVETHGNLREVFDRAGEEAALLCFDDGDAFFAPEQLDAARKEKTDELLPADYFFERVTAFDGMLLFCFHNRRHTRHLPSDVFDVVFEF